MKRLAALIIILSFLGGYGYLYETGPGSNKNPNWVRVNRVVDGDTFEIINKGKKEKVRLIGIDTPETVKPGVEVEPYGPESSHFTKKLIEGKKVRLEFDVQERDKYGRLLAYVYLEDGTLLNVRLLEAGLAVMMTVPPNVRMAETFLDIQKKARQQNQGVWSGQTP